MSTLIKTIQASNALIENLRSEGERLVDKSHKERERLNKSLHKMTLADLKAALPELHPTGYMDEANLRYKYAAFKPWGAAYNMEAHGATVKGLYVNALKLVAELQKGRA